MLKYEECNCDWSKDIETAGNCVRKCGCGEEHMMKCKSIIVHLEEQDWNLICAYKKLIKDINSLLELIH